ncbi:hypothetical protein A2291_06895 [candidate division WOR-1 bacterium RIFOXYB2_FULL_42_35]|uniref:Type II secretion system protein M n=1 Tax=candidate division WOR-1 bacterium RIFOXYC2_FULL_41_25 TaxID=1802586 RepID=A0A1F4TPK9_UNCSA|nr:MAG: hypothetical protein A2291_06895 [candidate division WOR-1 bacterium RIFOXYB2_FULL_42_35]OGC24605.1 MAG: hypothetical protein A2247_06675 [candidate division WOR-1 bacterium RIFOXYA2_FULL_41_14]OGC34651.1 MAG: hypothetical protein A2462_04910 [candidate division WOR-1 bacterium RIFOXYC2_FULL_41_25]OGC41600.1 MAG: hypothetical protein A2548_01225 [candidate division WOR-1 bacterium RIFOXYD2_FULL_41_8]
MIGFSSREKLLMFLAALLIGYFLFTHLLINPQLAAIARTKAEIVTMQQQLLKAELAAQLANATNIKETKVSKLYFKEEQVGLLINFVEASFKRYGISLGSMNQVDGQGRLGLQIDFTASYNQFLQFLDSLGSLNSYYLVDSIAVTEKQKKLIVKMQLAAPYK